MCCLSTEAGEGEGDGDDDDDDEELLLLLLPQDADDDDEPVRRLKSSSLKPDVGWRMPQTQALKDFQKFRASSSILMLITAAVPRNGTRKTPRSLSNRFRNN